MQIQISWLLKKPTELDLHCLQRQDISGFSRTRVKIRFVDIFSELEVEDIIHQNVSTENWSNPQFHHHDKGHNAFAEKQSGPQFHSQNKGLNAEKQKTGAKVNNQNTNNSAQPKQNTFHKAGFEKKQASFHQRGRGGGVNRRRADYSEGSGRGGVNHTRADYSEVPGRDGVYHTRADNSEVRFGAFEHIYNKPPGDDHFNGGYGVGRGGYGFYGCQDNRQPGYHPQNYGPHVQQDVSFDNYSRDYGYPMPGGRQRFPPHNNGVPFQQRGHPPPRGVSFPFHGGPYHGTPPGFQTGPSQGPMRGNFGRGGFNNSHRGNFGDFHGNKPNLSRPNFKANSVPKVSHSEKGDFYRNDRQMGNGPLERENDSPIFDASSGSGGSLDSLDDFSTSQAHRSKLNESLGGVIKEPKQPFLGQDGRLEGLVGLDQLGVPKGFLGDRVKNYYS